MRLADDQTSSSNLFGNSDLMGQTVQNTNATSCVCSFSWGEATRTVHWIEVVAFLPAKEFGVMNYAQRHDSTIVCEFLKTYSPLFFFPMPFQSHEKLHVFLALFCIPKGWQETLPVFQRVVCPSGKPIWRRMLNACGFGVPKIWIKVGALLLQQFDLGSPVFVGKNLTGMLFCWFFW